MVRGILRGDIKDNRSASPQSCTVGTLTLLYMFWVGLLKRSQVKSQVLN